MTETGILSSFAPRLNWRGSHIGHSLALYPSIEMRALVDLLQNIFLSFCVSMNLLPELDGTTKDEGTSAKVTVIRLK